MVRVKEQTARRRLVEVILISQVSLQTWPNFDGLDRCKGGPLTGRSVATLWWHHRPEASRNQAILAGYQQRLQHPGEETAKRPTKAADG